MPRRSAKITVDALRCEACGRCVQLCPQGNYSIEDDNGHLHSATHDKKCLHCGSCLIVCEVQALSVDTDGKSVASIDRAKCDACERCVLLCPDCYEMAVDSKGPYAVLKKGGKDAAKCAYVCPTGAIILT